MNARELDELHSLIALAGYVVGAVAEGFPLSREAAVGLRLVAGEVQRDIENLFCEVMRW